MQTIIFDKREFAGLQPTSPLGYDTSNFISHPDLQYLGV
jgi:hypothetical protein